MQRVLPVLLLIVATFGDVTGSEVLLTSNLTADSVAYDGQVIAFNCRVIDSGVLTWSSDEYIGTSGAVLQVSVAHEIGYVPPSPGIEGTIATLTNKTQVNGMNVIDSVLQIRATLLRPNSAITCRKNSVGGVANTTAFRVLPPEVLLTSNLTADGVAYDGEVIAFKCRVIDSGVLTWSSDEYIGTSGTVLQVSVAHEIGYVPPSSGIEGTVATLTNKTQVNGRNIIDSVLHIRATLLRPNSAITCRKSSVGGVANTTDFLVIESPATTVSVFQDETESAMTISMDTDPLSSTVDGAHNSHKGLELDDTIVIVIIAVSGAACICIVFIFCAVVITLLIKGRSSWKSPKVKQDSEKGVVNNMQRHSCGVSEGSKGEPIQRQSCGVSEGSNDSKRQSCGGSEGSDDSKDSNDLLLDT